jgi:integrase
MASLSRTKARTATGKAGWRIQFMDGAGSRRSIYLSAIPKKIAQSWVSRVEDLLVCRLTGASWSTDLATWVGELPDVSHAKLADAGLVEPRRSVERDPVTLGKLTSTFISRFSGKPSTVRGFNQTLQSLKDFFGENARLDAITAEGADDWRNWVVNDKKGSGRRKKKRTTDDNRLSPPTVAKRVSVAKQVFRAAVRWGWIEKNPFEGLRPGSQANPARARYVPLDTIMDVLDACPSVEWKLIVALPRMAGLRCPSEIGALTWGAINWEKGRMTVLAKKTEHHGADHAVRVVPICPALRAILADAFEQAEPGATLVVPMAARSSVNLRTHLERLITKAGHQPWPRLLQNLRASCETDWVERYPAHVVAKWLGHSPKVAAQHYLMSREHHFEDVVRGSGDAASGTTAGQGTGAAPGCSADCSAVVVQNAVQQAPATDSNESHETTEPAAATRVTAGSSEITPVTETGLMAGVGFEPTTSRL